MRTEGSPAAGALLRLALALAPALTTGAALADVRVYTGTDGILVLTDLPRDGEAAASAVARQGRAQATPGMPGAQVEHPDAQEAESRAYMESYERALADTGD
jgi:hypothetical protein